MLESSFGAEDADEGFALLASGASDEAAPACSLLFEELFPEDLGFAAFFAASASEAEPKTNTVLPSCWSAHHVARVSSA